MEAEVQQEFETVNPKSAERMKAFLDRAGKDQTLYPFKNLDDLRGELRIRVNEKAHQFHQVHVGNATGFSNGVSRLLENTAVVGDGIRTTIAEKTPILRRELLEELCRLIEVSPLVFVTGAAGFGKSALVKSAFTMATQGGIGFAFRARFLSPDTTLTKCSIALG